MHHGWSEVQTREPRRVDEPIDEFEGVSEDGDDEYDAVGAEGG